MAELNGHEPHLVLAEGDPGDDTASRYRFQWTWAAIVCCMLFDESQGVEEVFCEHHEDVLLKHRDGSFTGHQVKTRGEDQPPWKASDEAVLNACARFAKLENEFPGRFRKFCFLTNHQLQYSSNGQDLSHVLISISEANTIEELPFTVRKWLSRVAKCAEVTDEVTFLALAKTAAIANLPKLRDATVRLIDTIAQCWPPAADCSHSAVRRAAYALIDECGRASSLDRGQLLPAYLVAVLDEASDIALRIGSKRMTLERVEALLLQGRDDMAILECEPSQQTAPGLGSTELLQKKLDTGGFSAVSRNSAEDLRDKADYLGIKWTKQHGNTKGLARYGHVRSIVLSDAGRAFDVTQNEEDSFGPSMREELRRSLRARRDSGDEFFDATDDHLEGIAFSLTAQCKVVWSHARPWED